MRLCAGDERIDWLLHKKPLFHLHWKDGRVPLDVREKIVVIPGDLHEPDLGLSPEDRQRICSEVEVVIHSAASISFFEHIHTLLEQNYDVSTPAACMHACMPASASCLRAVPACLAMPLEDMQCHPAAPC